METIKLQYQYSIRLGRQKSDEPDDVEWEEKTFEIVKERIGAEVQKFLEEQVKKTKSAAAFYNNMARGGNKIAKEESGVVLLEAPEHDPLEELLNGKSAIIDYEGKDGRIEAHHKKPELIFRCFAAVGHEEKITSSHSFVGNLDYIMQQYIGAGVEFSNKNTYTNLTKLIEDNVAPIKI